MGTQKNADAIIAAFSQLLQHLGEREVAERILAGVRAVLAEGASVTYDIRRTNTRSTEGAVGTQAYADAIIATL